MAVEWIDGALVLSVAGDLDYDTTPAFQRDVLDLLGAPRAVLVLDLLAVTFLGSAGLAALIEIAHLCKSRTTLRLVATGAATLRPIQLAGLHNYFRIYPTRRAALTA